MTNLSASALDSALAPRPVRYFDRTASTNAVALEWLRAGGPSGAVVVADEQTAGRGRLGRAWHAPAGTALLLSILLRPEPAALPRVTMLAALAVAETLEGLGAAQVGIKWPNDVRLGQRKVCGVLPEALWSGETLEGVALGIGLNIAVPFEGELARSATNVLDALIAPVDRLDVLVRLLARVDAWAERLESVALFANWRRRLLLMGERVNVTTAPGVTLRGVAEAVEADGALVLRGEDGVLQRVVAGDLMPGDRG